MAHATRLFVGNLPDNLNENALREAFSSYGDITNFDLKCKPGIENDKKKFAFITISASNFNIESCIKYFSNEEFQGNKLYVTRARESFLERLQRERVQSQKNDTQQLQIPDVPQTNQKHHNHNKRMFNDDCIENILLKKKSKNIIYDKPKDSPVINYNNIGNDDEKNNVFQNNEKKQNSDKKRLESMKKKRQEFNEKKNIIKSGLISIDKKPNKKIVFSDTEDNNVNDIVIANGHNKPVVNNKANLFDDEASDEDINFEIKEQFEGKKGQKVLDLQSRYKSDKRFVLDERFAEESSDKEEAAEDDIVDLKQADEKSKQLNILQDVLGITIKMKPTETTSKTKPKLGMLRFDPTQPQHAKYLAPVEAKEAPKKSKKKKLKDKESIEDEIPNPEPVIEKVEVSKEQFYKISETLKETISQPNSFSLRSLFTRDHVEEDGELIQQDDYILIQPKKPSKVKNPLDPGEKNPFVYDSSESENEEENKNNENEKQTWPAQSENKTVWREKLFFSSNDYRLKDGLLFFSKMNESEGQKERRELKSLMKKRIYNKERKTTMFKKKIGGRNRTMKKKFKKS